MCLCKESKQTLALFVIVVAFMFYYCFLQSLWKLLHSVERLIFSYRLLHIYLVFSSLQFEPEHDKTNKMTCAPIEDSDQPGHMLSLISLHYSGRRFGP